MVEGSAAVDAGGELPCAVLGVDHHRTEVSVREKLAPSAADQPRLLAALTALPGVSEAMALSTCNRLECYLAGSPDRQQVVNLLAEFHGLSVDQLESHAYWHSGRQAARHLLRVVSGLESLVIGEHQIVNQVKSAFDLALSCGSIGAVLNPLVQRALAAAKEVRNSTAIGKHKLSVASVAVDLARHIYGELSRARLLVVGAGEIAELALRYLLAAGVRELSVINRNAERASALAEEVHAQALPWAMLGEALVSHDIVVTSTAAPHAVISEADVRNAMRRRRTPLMFIDLAVPRDVEPQIGRIAEVYLYNIDHLETVVAANRDLRAEEVEAAATLVDVLTSDYLTAMRRERNQGALFAQVATYFQDIIAAEEVRLGGKLHLHGNPELRYGLERVANKLQHRVLRFLRDHPDEAAAVALVREMLGLE